MSSLPRPTPPTSGATLVALVRAELRSLGRSWNVLLWTVAVPVLILALGETQVPAHDPHPALSTWQIATIAQVVGTFSLGLFGYATVMAAYRDRGVFQRLRCTPAPHWQIPVARMLTQFAAVLLEALVVYLVARLAYHAAPTPAATALAVLAAALAGVASLALGQAVVALGRSAQSVTAASRLILVALFLSLGVFVRVTSWPAWLQRVDHATPVYLASSLLTDALVHAAWHGTELRDLGGLAVWILVLGYVGLGRFRWSPSA